MDSVWGRSIPYVELDIGVRPEDCGVESGGRRKESPVEWSKKVEGNEYMPESTKGYRYLIWWALVKLILDSNVPSAT